MNFLNNNNFKKYFIIFLILIINITFVSIRIFDIYRPLWNDELISLSTLQVNPLENPLYNEISTNLPLFYYLIKIGSFFMINGVELRFVTLILSIIFLNLIIYFYYKEKSLSYLLLAILVTLSPIQIYYSQELRSYMLTSVLLLAIFLQVKRILNHEKINFKILSIFIFLATISHYTSFIFIAALFVYLLFSKQVTEKVLKTFLIPCFFSSIILIAISGNTGFSDSTSNSVLNFNFKRLTYSHLVENLKKTNEVITIYFNFGLHYYRLDEGFTSIFKKLMYLVFLIGAFLFLNKKAPDTDFKFSGILLIILLVLSIIFDMLGLVPFGGRYLFPFNFLYLFVLSKILEKIYEYNKILFGFVLTVIIVSYMSYNLCLIKNLNIFTGNNDPQGIIIQSCFK